MKRRENIIILFAWMFMLIAPYLFGILMNSQESEFLGFLINPIDGVSYLAKMNQGANGKWLFHLPYASNTHPKVFLFSFYILIGKLSSLMFGDLRIGFHFFRVLCSIFFYYQFILFVENSFEKGVVSRFLKIGVLFGGGLGWLYLLNGDIPADFWVADAFPFLASFVNPHFILSLGLILFLLRMVNKIGLSNLEKTKLFLAAAIMANISPFAVVIGGIILFAAFLWELFSLKEWHIEKMAIYAAAAAPFLFYQYWIVRTIELLASWNAQNLTPAPLLLNFIFSFSPFLIANLVLAGIIAARKIPINKLQFVLVTWNIIALILVYLPIDLQRRFMVGYYLAVILLFYSLLTTMIQFGFISLGKIKRLLVVLTIVILPSNFLLMIGALDATRDKNENLFIPRTLLQSYEWLNDFGVDNGVVLSEEQEGINLPAFANQRVVIGHPFETPYYENTLTHVDEFFSGNLKEYPRNFYRIYHVDYVLVPKHRTDRIEVYLRSLDLSYENETYYIFAVKQ